MSLIKLIVKILIATIAVLAADKVVGGVLIPDFKTALIVAIVLGLLNHFVRPVIMLFALPINLLTLGLFSLVVNGLIVLIAANLVPGLFVSSLLAAILFSLIISAVEFVLSIFI